jgi:hypothetical protein
MKSINREKLIAETLIREHVRKRIEEKLNYQRLVEDKLRKHIRKLLEAETGTEEPSVYTGINVLADLLKNIIPTIEDDYKMLTTSAQQRESFRNHMIHAIKNALNPVQAVSDAERVGESYEFEVDKNELLEALKIDLDAGDDKETVSGEFIDIEDQQDEKGSFGAGLEDQNETGRNFAHDSFKRVEKQIVDAYDMLADEEDEKLFYDYLLTNMMLYFDKFEDELQSTLPASSTPEYEKEKEELQDKDEEEEQEIGAEASAEEDSEELEL